MTVHGAKGLEAPIVILPDTAERQDARNPPQILPADPPLWRMPADACAAAVATAEGARRKRAGDENRRLLYVALTRAETWLIVAGAGRKSPSSWHAMVADALATLGPAADGDATAIERNWTDARAVAAPGGADAPALPDWARRPPPAAATDPAPRSPSALGGAHALPGEGADEATALARGSAIHALLETLPSRPRDRWADLATRLVPGLEDALFAEAVAVLDAPALAPLFAPDALVETEIVATLGDVRIAGRIDRLIVAPDRVLAVDFKSNRVVPDRPEATPEAILRQMGAYAAALAAIYPGRRVETAVAWTRTATLMPLPGELTAAALARSPFLDPVARRPYVTRQFPMMEASRWRR